MANEVTLPRLGWDMEEGALGGWLKNEGDFVNAGDLLFTVEGDKAVQEIEALDSGYLRIAPNAPAVGVKVPVGTLLGFLVSEEELASFRSTGSPVTPISSAAGDALGQALASTTQPNIMLTVSDGPAKDQATRRLYISPHRKPIEHPLLRQIPRQMLHAYQLSFVHPYTQKAVSVTAPVPDDFNQCLKLLGLEE